MFVLINYYDSKITTEILWGSSMEKCKNYGGNGISIKQKAKMTLKIMPRMKTRTETDPATTISMDKITVMLP